MRDSRIRRRSMCMMAAVVVLSIVAGSSRTGDGHRQDPPMVMMAGWTAPDARYLNLHSEGLERLPFTGTLTHISWPYLERGAVKNNAIDGALCWQAFHDYRFTDEMLERSLADLQQADAKLTRVKDNFLWVVSSLRGGYFDWYDDERWDIVLHNVEMLARYSKAGGLKGIMLDCEEYGCQFWSWGGSRPNFALKNVPAYADKTWDQTRQQVRSRGRQFAEALNRGYPDIMIWMLYGYSHVDYAELPDDLSNSDNGLLAAFVDGLLEGATDETIFIDGCEGGYFKSEVEEFEKLREKTKETALRYTMVPELYKKKIRMGFGIDMELAGNYPGSHPWYGDRPDENYQTPARLEKAVRNALVVGDGYVWIYSQYPSWWLTSADDTFGEGAVSHPDHKYLWISPVYHDAIRAALKSWEKQ